VPSCRVVLRTIRSRPQGRLGLHRVAYLRTMLNRLGQGASGRACNHQAPRALRRLRRGTWQVRLGARWLPLERLRVHRGPGWLHVAGQTPSSGLEAGMTGRVVRATVWRHRVPADAWRRLGVAVGAARNE